MLINFQFEVVQPIFSRLDYTLGLLINGCRSMVFRNLMLVLVVFYCLGYFCQTTGSFVGYRNISYLLETFNDWIELPELFLHRCGTWLKDKFSKQLRVCWICTPFKEGNIYDIYIFTRQYLLNHSRMWYSDSISH